MTDACALAGACDVMDRRAWLSTAAVAAAGAALTACGLSADPTAPTTLSPQTIKVGDFAALANTNGVALLTSGGSPIAVVRTGATTFAALSRICPHRGTTINTSTTGFECPRHHARFDVTGTWIGGERTSSLRSYPAAYDATSDTLTIG